MRTCFVFGLCCAGGACASLQGHGAQGGESRSRGLEPSAVPSGRFGTAMVESGPASGSAHSERDWNQLNERVRFLERRLSEMDVKIALMAERLDGQSGPEAPRWASTGEPLSTQVSGTEALEILSAPDASPPGSEGLTETGAVSAASLPTAPSHVESGYVTDSAPVTSPSEEEPSSIGEKRDAERLPSAGARTDSDPDAAPALRDAADVKAAYSWAQRQQQAGNWREAERVFSQIHKRFQKHSLGDNALYWAGVAQATGGDPRRAIQTFAQVPVRYPQSPKIPDALFGMARAHEKLGEPLLAEVLYGQLLEEYPKAEKRAAAKRAMARLTHPNP